MNLNCRNAASSNGYKLLGGDIEHFTTHRLHAPFCRTSGLRFTIRIWITNGQSEYGIRFDSANDFETRLAINHSTPTAASRLEKRSWSCPINKIRISLTGWRSSEELSIQTLRRRRTAFDLFKVGFRRSSWTA
jgi:hypothetical protein